MGVSLLIKEDSTGGLESIQFLMNPTRRTVGKNLQACLACSAFRPNTNVDTLHHICSMRWGHDLPEELAPLSFILRARTVPLRNLGGCLSPDNAWMIIQGVLFVVYMCYWFDTSAKTAHSIPPS